MSLAGPIRIFAAGLAVLYFPAQHFTMEMFLGFFTAYQREVAHWQFDVLTAGKQSA
jgi:hypothetical protein